MDCNKRTTADQLRCPPAALAPALHAQQANKPSLVGVVSDGSGAQISGATVTATHVATNTAVNVLTDERGQYRTPPLRIGDYEVTVQLDGFRTFVRRGASTYQRFENSLAALYV